MSSWFLLPIVHFSFLLPYFFWRLLWRILIEKLVDLFTLADKAGNSFSLVDRKHTLIWYHVSTNQPITFSFNTSYITKTLIFLCTLAQSEAEKTDVNELEITPVSAAIANYLGIVLTQEGRAARNRRRISIVVHGAPFSGKTNTAIELSKIYNAALLNVDSVVTEVIQLGTTTAGKSSIYSWLLDY